MLRHLRVTNFAILSDVAIELEGGFNVLTGETGAGKSLIVEAVNLLRGGRASADIPRAGADQAVVEAIFELSDLVRTEVLAHLDEAGIPADEHEILVRRVIQRGGRSRTYINGALTTATCLAEIGAHLVDLSGQHQHQGLVDPKRHRAILDGMAENDSYVARMSAAHAAWLASSKELAEIREHESSREERLDYLRFQLEELQEAKLKPGEEESLAEDHKRLSSVDKLRAAAEKCETLLYTGDDSAVDQLHQACAALQEVAECEPVLASCLQLMEESRTLAEEAARSIQRYGSSLEADPALLAEIEDRLDVLKRLTRKHRSTIEELHAKEQEFARELTELEGLDDRRNELEARCKNLEKAAKEAAATLRKRRKKAALRLSKEVQPALAELGMTSAQLIVHLEDAPLSASGTDHVEFLLAANRGEVAKPLSRVASGGELSRIMLALKLVLRKADHVDTYVFDEVDTGIGGSTAGVVGEQIRDVASQRQVLCVTHLPQIAAFADAHFHVSKCEVEGRTETEVSKLTLKQRSEEIARMVGGVKVSAQAKAHAKSMLAAAREGGRARA